MRAIYIILFIGSFIFSSCLKTDEFEVSSEDLRENAVKLNNPIRFDQLAVGQKSTYVLISPDSCHMPICCQQKSITRQVEIIKQDTNGYLIKETTNSNNSTPLFFYLKYELRKVLRDTLENEPSLKEYDELLAIKTVAIDEDNYYRSAIYGRIGAKFYLNNPTQKPFISKEIENTCEVFFLPERIDDPLPFRDDVYHSELGIIKNYTYEDVSYGDQLIMNHDYGYGADAFNYTYAYTLDKGLVFSGTFKGSYLYGAPVVWHILPDN